MIHLLALIALLVHPALRDLPAATDMVVTGHSVTWFHVDDSTTTTSVGNYFSSLAEDPAADPARELTSEWVDARGVTHRVRTMGSAGRSARAIAQEHAEQVREMQAVFPPRPVTPK